MGESGPSFDARTTANQRTIGARKAVTDAQAEQQPFFDQLLSLFSAQADDPFTLTPEIIDQIRASATGTADRAARQRSQSAAVRSSVGGRNRDASAGAEQRRIRTETAGQLGNLERDLTVQARQQRAPDLAALAQMFLPTLGQMAQLPIAEANVLSQGAGAQAGIASANAANNGFDLGGLGSLLGLGIGAAFPPALPAAAATGFSGGGGGGFGNVGGPFPFGQSGVF